MRILFIAHNGQAYGANKSLYSVMKYMSKEHSILLFTPFKNNFLDDQNIKNKNIPFYPSIFFIKKDWKYILYPFLIFWNILIFPYLLIQLRLFKPDIIYSNSSVENMGKILSLFTRAKHITHVREFGDLDYNFYCILGKNFKRFFLNLSDGLIFNSKIVQKEVLPKVSLNAKVKVIYNGIKFNNIQPHNKKETFNVGLIGFIHPKKGQLEAVKFMTEILQHNKNIFLHIIGTGQLSYIKKIKKYLIKNDIEDKVLFLGFIKEPEKIYGNLSASLVFSKNEAFGRVTIESMLKGVPVMAFDGGGSSEIITSKEDGILFEKEEDFTSNFMQLYNDNNFYKRIQENGIKKIITYFSEEKYVILVDRFINDIKYK